MALTWETLLADLRVDMKDTGETPKLAASTAYLYLKWALQDYSHFNPYITSTTLDLDSDGIAALPTDCIRVLEVRDPDTDYLINPLRGINTNPPGHTIADKYRRWWEQGTNLRMNTWGNDPDTVTLFYEAYHAAPDDADDTTHVFTFPEYDERPILLHIRASDMNTIRSRQSKLDRYKLRVQAGNTRTDNPAAPEELNLMDEFLQIMYDRYGSRTVRLLRRRRA